VDIIPAHDAQYLPLVRTLFQEYWASFGFTPCFQNFSDELEGLPGDYAPPDGRLAVAMLDGLPAGCAAFRRFDAERCEAKRLWVRPAYRGRGVGGGLLNWIVAEARAAGYREIVGDTMPEMAQALAMYDRHGFDRTAPYAANPTPGAIFLRLKL
jgi:carbonic anhydrase